MEPANPTLQTSALVVKCGDRAQRQQERKALLDKPITPTVLETWIYEESRGKYVYSRRLDFKTCHTLNEVGEFTGRYIATSEEDGFDVSLWMDGEPIAHMLGRKGADPWR